MNKLNLYIALILTFTFLTSCKSEKKDVEDVIVENTQNELLDISLAQFENEKMEFVKLTEQEFSSVIKTNGFIDVPPANKAKVSAIIGGYIKNSPLLVGNKVKKGQLLLTIENPEFIEVQQEYLETVEKLKFLKSEFERQKTLSEEKITSKKKYLEAESNYKSTLATSRGLEKKLRLMNVNISNVLNGNFTSVISIFAPISGVVSNVNVSTGEFVEATDVILEINDTHHKHLELIVFEKDVLKVKENQKIVFSTPENSNIYYRAHVYLIGNEINDINRTVKIHAHLANEEEPFLVGMFVEAEIEIASNTKMAVPVGTVLEEDDQFYILVLNEKRADHYEFIKTKVTILDQNEKWVAIESDKNLNNKEILGKGAFLPLSGEGGHSH